MNSLLVELTPHYPTLGTVLLLGLALLRKLNKIDVRMARFGQSLTDLKQRVNHMECHYESLTKPHRPL